MVMVMVVSACAPIVLPPLSAVARGTFWCTAIRDRGGQGGRPLFHAFRFLFFRFTPNAHALAAIWQWYFMQTFGLSVGQVSLFCLFTSVPSCSMSAVAGPLLNRFGGRAVLGAGLAMQGIFTMLVPKDRGGSSGHRL